MSKDTRHKVVILTAMIAVLLLRSMADLQLGLVLLLFGAANTLAGPRGTGVVRGFAVAAVFIGLGWPDTIGIVLAMACLLWIPAYVIAVVVPDARDGSSPIVDALEPLPDDASNATSYSSVKSRVVVAAVILSVVVAALFYQSLGIYHLQQTAALFIGIPGVLAIVVVLLVSPRSAVGVALKAVTVGMLVSVIFLHEGALCVLMASPLFYGIAALIGGAADEARRARKTSTRWLSGAMLLAFLPMSLEGVTDVTTLNRNESISESRIVHASAGAVERALFAPPRFDRKRPAYLRSGFPSAIATRLERDANGTRWVIRMRGGEMLINGMEPMAGDLVLALEESRPGLLRWRAIADTSHMTHFLNWRESIVRWQSIDAQTTKVTWTLNYRRGLDPSWYFGPMERYAVHLAAGYLIDTVATP